jgi:iron complex outermembrane recepter protein
MTSHRRPDSQTGGWVLDLRATLLAASGLALAATWGTAAAQQAEEEQAQAVDEIVVFAPNYVSTGSRSATKSDAPLVEIPQSVTVISRDQIDLLHWTSLQQSVRYTAGAIGENFGPDERYDWLTVRGFNPAQYIDGLQAPIGSVSNVGTDLYGFEAVDILKGPSSVLYGHAPPGGIVNMRSRRPEDQFRGEVGGQYGSFDHKQLNLDVTGPLSDMFSGRFTALYRDRGTQVDFMDSERLYVAPALTAMLTPRTPLTLLAYFQRDEIDNPSTGFLPAAGTSLPNPLGKVPVGRNLGEPGVNFYDRDQYGVGYDFSHELSESVVLQQNLKYFSSETESRAIYGVGLLDEDFDGVPDDFRTVQRFDFPFNEDVASFNVDTRASLDFHTGDLEHTLLLGVDFRRYDIESEFAFSFAPSLDLFEPVYGAPVDEPVFFPFVDQVQRQTGLYAQDQVRFGGFVLTASARHDWVKSDDPGSKTSDEEFSYRAGLNYVFESGWAPYAQAARSFEPVSGADFDGNPFEPTTGDQVEFGLKYDGRNLSRELRLFASAAAYRLVQKNVLTPDPDPSRPFFSVQAGEVEVQGIELEIVARYRERLSVNAAYGFTDSEVTRSNGPDLGQRLPMVPRQMASLLVDYTMPVGPLAGLGAGVGARYLGETYGDPANDWKNDSVTLLDATLHYNFDDWRLALNANNLTDKIYVARCSSAADCFYGTRRVVTASLTRSF